MNTGNSSMVVLLAFFITICSSSLAELSPSLSLSPDVLETANQVAQNSMGSDRANKSGGANAGAIVGAAIAGAMCAYFMAKAAMEPDPELKQQYEMMAAMECAQAAQSAAAAGENGDNQDTLTQYDTPKAVQIHAKQRPIEQRKRNQPARAQRQPRVHAVELGEETRESEKPESNTPRDAELIETRVETTEIQTTTLPVIDKALLGYREDAKPGGKTPVPSPVGQAVAVSSSQSMVTEDLKKVVANSALTSTGRKAHSLEIMLGDATDANHGESRGGTGSIDLGGLFGKARPEETAKNSGPDIIILPRRTHGQTVNIFQYASFRLRDARSDGVIGIKPVKKIRTAIQHPRTDNSAG